MSVLDDLFGPADSDLFTTYRGTLQVLNRLTGGIPKDPNTIKKWIESRIEGGNDAALAEIMAETIEAMGEEATTPALAEAMAKRVSSGNGFKRVDGVLTYESRCLKAALKEAANVLYPNVTDYPGKRAGSRKGLKSVVAETIFVGPEFLSLGVSEPDVVGDQRLKHITGPKGPQSTIAVVDLVIKPRIEFEVRVLNDWVPPKLWRSLWEYIGQDGIGSDRARGDGQNEIVSWEKVA